MMYHIVIPKGTKMNVNLYFPGALDLEEEI